MIKKKHWFIILFLIIINIIITLHITVDRELPIVNYIEEPVHYQESIRGHNLVNEDFYNLVEFLRSTSHAPLHYLISLILMITLGKTVTSIILTNIIFLGVGFIATYKLGDYLDGSKTAIYSTIIFSLIPGYFIWSRAFVLENGLVAFIPLSAYLLIKTENFKNTSYTLFFSLSVILGMMTKISFVLYFLPIITYYFIRKKSYTKIIRNKNLIIMIIFIIIIMILWKQNIFLAEQIKINIIEAGNRGSLPSILSSESLIFYPDKIFFQYLQPLIGLIFVISSIILVRKRDHKKSNILFAGLSTILIFIIIPNKQVRFILPLTSFFSLIIAMGLTRISNIKIRLLYAFLILLSTSYLFMLLIFSQNISDKLVFEEVNNMIYDNNEPVMFNKDYNINFEKLFFELEKLNDNKYIFLSNEFIESYILDYYSDINNYNITFIEICSFFPETNHDEKIYHIEDYNLLTTGELKFEEYNFLYEKVGVDCQVYPYEENFREAYKYMMSRFQLYKTVILNKDLNIHIYIQE